MSIPIHLVEEHNEALRFILKGIGSKRLNFTENFLIHFDSHPDLLVHDDLKGNEVMNKNVLIEKVCISTWIMPLLYAGHFSTVLWVKPKWSPQIPEGCFKFNIGHHISTGRVCVDCSEIYFVGGEAYAPPDELCNAKSITLYVYYIDSLVQDMSIVTQILSHHESYVLDIDLDFYSTKNPFLDLYPEVELYKKLVSIYKISYDPKLDCAQKASNARNKQMKQLENFFNALKSVEEDNFHKTVTELLDVFDEPAKEDLVRLVHSLWDLHGKNVDWEEIHNAGGTIDTSEMELPHHVSSKAEIDTYLELTEKLLRDWPQPKLVTIARSSLDDFCPISVVDEIQQRVLKIIQPMYKNNVFFNYIDK